MRSLRGVHALFRVRSSTCHSKRLFTDELGHGKVRLTDILNDWIKRLEANGILDASSSVEYIAAHVLGKKTLHNVDKHECHLDQCDVAAINNLSRLRLKRMPVQYILGEWDFDAMTLKMTPPVFIPRPETEELVDHCKDILESNQSLWETNPVIVELGCGSGAISLALLSHFKKLQSICVDILPEACVLTKRNAEIVGVEDRIHIVNGDFTDRKVLSVLHSLGPFSFLVSNPPYVTLDEMKDLSPEIERFEHPVALNGGIDGLDIVRHILYHAGTLLIPNGHIFLEVGENHPATIKDLVTKSNRLCLQFISGKKDMYGRNRFCHLKASER